MKEFKIYYRYKNLNGAYTAAVQDDYSLEKAETAYKAMQQFKKEWKAGRANRTKAEVEITYIQGCGYDAHISYTPSRGAKFVA